jgi:hypothetical protein
MHFGLHLAIVSHDTGLICRVTLIADTAFQISHRSYLRAIKGAQPSPILNPFIYKMETPVATAGSGLVPI